jgi:hypothetical protein
VRPRSERGEIDEAEYRAAEDGAIDSGNAMQEQIRSTSSPAPDEE